jgi:hypothetical protein
MLRAILLGGAVASAAFLNGTSVPGNGQQQRDAGVVPCAWLAGDPQQSWCSWFQTIVIFPRQQGQTREGERFGAVRNIVRGEDRTCISVPMLDRRQQQPRVYIRRMQSKESAVSRRDVSRRMRQAWQGRVTRRSP